MYTAHEVLGDLNWTLEFQDGESRGGQRLIFFFKCFH